MGKYAPRWNKISKQEEFKRGKILKKKEVMYRKMQMGKTWALTLAEIFTFTQLKIPCWKSEIFAAIMQ